MRDVDSGVSVQSFAPFGAAEPAADPDGIKGVIAAFGGEDDRLGHLEVDLADPPPPAGILTVAGVEEGLTAFVEQAV